MKILFLTPRVPHAGIAGGHQLVYQRIQRLISRGHEVGIISFDDGERGGAEIADLQDKVADFVTLPAPRKAGTLARAWGFLTSPTPPYFNDYRSAAMLRRVGDVVHEQGYSVVLAEFSAMGQYLVRNPYLPAVRKVISCHYSIADTYANRAETWGFRTRGLRSRLNVGRLRTYELDLFRSVDQVLVFTAHDYFKLEEMDPALRLQVIHAGVDTVRFKPGPAPAVTPRLVFTGNYEMYENIDAVEWFLRSVWPLVRQRHPEAVFTMIGPGAEKLLRGLADRDPHVFATGRVDDVRPHLQEAMIFVCPIRIGGGFHFKLLEAMASGIPVVTTSVAAEGIPLQTGENCFVADRPDLLARCIDLLIADEDLRTDFATRSRALVKEKFDWERCIDALEATLEGLRKR